MAHRKKKGTLYITSVSGGINFSCFVGVGCRVVVSETWKYEQEGNEDVLSKDKMSGLKSVELDFYEHCVYGMQKRVSFLTVRKDLKA